MEQAGAMRASYLCCDENARVPFGAINSLILNQDGVLPSGEQEKEGASVTFSNVQPRDAGVYICTAQDETKTVHKTVQVRKVSLVKNKVHFKAK